MVHFISELQTVQNVPVYDSKVEQSCRKQTVLLLLLLLSATLFTRFCVQKLKDIGKFKRTYLHLYVTCASIRVD